MRIRPSYLRFYVTLLAALILFSLRNTFAQSLGDLARQERARKLARQSRVTKVYTNEDLQREVIVAPDAAPGQDVVLAETTPAEKPAPSIPVHLTLAPAAIPAKETPVPSAAIAERAVPTVPVWPAGMPLGDIARYYRQQVAPQIPAGDDRQLQEALASRPALRDYASDKLQVTLAAATPAPVAAVSQERKNLGDLNLPAPFVMASVEGSSVPVIENVADATLPGFPSPAVRLELAASSAKPIPATSAQVLRFAAPEMPEVVLSFDTNASLGIPSVGTAEFAAPLYDSSRDPLTIRFAAPPAPPALEARRTPIARTVEAPSQPEIRATIASTSSLETVSPWRYADEIPAAPVAAAPQKMVVVSTAEPAQNSLPAVEQEVRVRRGDSLWLLALRHLGDGHAWPQIAAANPQITDPNHIVAGERLRVPAVAMMSDASPTEARTAQPATPAGKSVTVRKGDSLWKLAESGLGNGAAWNCIAAANPQITDANRIFAGQTLVLPSDCNSRS